jgi:hypothetical protein
VQHYHYNSTSTPMASMTILNSPENDFKPNRTVVPSPRGCKDNNEDLTSKVHGTTNRRLQLSTGKTRTETGKSSSEPSVTAFINIKLNLGDCLEDGGKNDFNHRQQQIVIGIENSPDIYDYYLENGWYIGCYFVNNPFNTILSIYEFEELFRYAILKLGFNEEGKKYFKGDSYEQLFIKIEKMMERLIKTLDDTKGGKKWSYKEDNIGRIKLNFQKIDQFLNENIVTK